GGDARFGQRTHRVRRTSGAVLRILVVVEEDAAPLLLPPLGRRQRGCAPLDLAGERECRATHLAEAPPRMDTDVHVHAARATRLRPTAQTKLVEQCLRLRRHATEVLP